PVDFPRAGRPCRGRHRVPQPLDLGQHRVQQGILPHTRRPAEHHQKSPPPAGTLVLHVRAHDAPALALSARSRCASRWATVSGCTADKITCPETVMITARVRRLKVASTRGLRSRASCTSRLMGADSGLTMATMRWAATTLPNPMLMSLVSTALSPTRSYGLLPAASAGAARAPRAGPAPWPRAAPPAGPAAVQAVNAAAPSAGAAGSAKPLQQRHALAVAQSLDPAVGVHGGVGGHLADLRQGLQPVGDPHLLVDLVVGPLQHCPQSDRAPLQVLAKARPGAAHRLRPGQGLPLLLRGQLGQSHPLPPRVIRYSVPARGPFPAPLWLPRPTGIPGRRWLWIRWYSIRDAILVRGNPSCGLPAPAGPSGFAAAAGDCQCEPVPR